MKRPVVGRTPPTRYKIKCGFNNFLRIQHNCKMTTPFKNIKYQIAPYLMVKRFSSSRYSIHLLLKDTKKKTHKKHIQIILLGNLVFLCFFLDNAINNYCNKVIFPLKSYKHGTSSCNPKKRKPTFDPGN